MAQLKLYKNRQFVIRVLGGLIATVLVIFGVFAYANKSFTLVRADAQESQSDLSEDKAETQAVTSNAVTAPKTAETVFVHVDGAVVNPGVYELQESARVQDAVLAAGGLTEGADTTNVNLASVVADGQKIWVPSVNDTQSQSSAAGDGSSSGSSSSSLVNINKATVDELDTLPGIGPSTAQTIIKDRDKSGAFSSIEDIMRVSGIGEKKFEKIKDYICV